MSGNIGYCEALLVWSQCLSASNAHIFQSQSIVPVPEEEPARCSIMPPMRNVGGNSHPAPPAAAFSLRFESPRLHLTTSSCLPCVRPMACRDSAHSLHE